MAKATLDDIHALLKEIKEEQECQTSELEALREELDRSPRKVRIEKSNQEVFFGCLISFLKLCGAFFILMIVLFFVFAY